MTSDFSVAVHALVYLKHKACMLSSEELAENICTNPARVRKVMAKLKSAGLVETKEGVEGGYRLIDSSGEITLTQVAEALQVRFVSANWRSGSQDMICLVASGMAKIMDDILDEMDTCCKQRLRKKTIANIENEIFKKDLR